MARRSLNRDILDARMEFNPEKKAHLLITSKYRKHMKESYEMTKRVVEATKRAQEVVAEVMKDPTEE